MLSSKTSKSVSKITSIPAKFTTITKNYSTSTNSPNSSITITEQSSSSLTTTALSTSTDLSIIEKVGQQAINFLDENKVTLVFSLIVLLAMLSGVFLACYKKLRRKRRPDTIILPDQAAEEGLSYPLTPSLFSPGTVLQQRRRESIRRQIRESS